jgi:preprotein translocase subunit SecG
MYTFLSILYVFVCLFLILVVLLQSGKGGGLGSAFGGSSTQIFGGAGAGNLLTRLTAVSAFLFMTLSVGLAFLSTSGEQALDRAVREQAAAQEAAAEIELEEVEAAAAEAEAAAAAEAEAEVEAEVEAEIVEETDDSEPAATDDAE